MEQTTQRKRLLRALIVEDSEDDTYFLIRELKKGGYDVSFVRVDTEEGMKSCLTNENWDIIFSDYSMPHFSGIEALDLLNRSEKDIPLILVSGAIGEEVAVEAMRSGANDYILKSNMKRLLPAVDRTLREARDRQARRAVEIALRASEERFTRFAEKAVDILFIYHVADPEGFEYLSPSVNHILGYTPQDFYDNPDQLRDVVHPDDLAELFTLNRTSSDPTRALYLRGFRRDGEMIWIELRMVFIRDDSGNLVTIEGIARDITDLKRSQLELQESEAKFRQLAENIRQVFWIRDFPTQDILYISPAYEDLWGKSCQSLYEQHQSFMDDIHPGDINEIRMKFAESIETGRFNAEYRLSLPNGVVRWIWARQFPIFNENGKIVRTAGIAEDITYRKQHEREVEAIATISSALSKAEIRSEMLPVVLEQVCATLESDCAVFLSPDSSQNCRVEMGWGGWQSLTSVQLDSCSPINPKNKLINTTVDGFKQFVALRNADRRHMTWVELSAQDTFLGILVVGRGGKGESIPFTAEENKLLGSLANITANALLRSSLFEQTNLRLKYLTALHEVDMGLTTYQSLQDVLSTVVDETNRITGADGIDILVYSPEQNCLLYSEGRGIDQQFPREVRIQMGAPLPGLAAQEKRIIVLNDLDLDKNFLRQSWIKERHFKGYCAVPLVFKDQIKGVLELFYRQPLVVDAELENFLQSTAIQAAMAIENTELFDGLKRTNEELEEAYDKTILGWSRALELRDHETQGHAERVADFTLKLARQLHIAENQLVYYRWGALLHDIGKMGIPDSILSKPGMLTDAEWEIMRMHPVFGFELLEPIAFLRPALDIPRYHHEKWDGGGYPTGISGNDIPLSARVFALVDVWDALTSHRPYRAAWSKDRATRFIIEQSGKHFDPAVVEAFLAIREEIP